MLEPRWTFIRGILTVCSRCHRRYRSSEAVPVTSPDQRLTASPPLAPHGSVPGNTDCLTHTPPPRGCPMSGADPLGCPVSHQQDSGARPHTDIPGPASYPIIGSLYKYLPVVGEYSIHDQMGTDRKRYKEFGPLVRERMFPGFTVYHVYDLDLIQQVYRQESRYPERFPLPGLKAYRKDRGVADGLALTSGEEWRRLRRSASDLMRPKYLENFVDEQNQIADGLNSLITTLRDDDDKIKDSLPIFHRFALESVGNVLFGKRLGTLDPHLSQDTDAMKVITAVQGAMEALYHTTYMWPLHQSKRTRIWKKLCQTCDFIREYAVQCKQEMEDGTKNCPQSYLKMLLSKPELSTEDALTIIADIVFAGIETTGHVVAFNVYNLARNPATQQKLYEEIQKHAPEGKDLDRQSISEMKYLKAVMKETFRFTPLGVGNARILSQDTVMNGYTIPSGSLMLLNNLMAGESEEYVKEPERYLPERWLWRGNDDTAKLHPYLVQPFGTGSRSCLGRRLAMQEIQIAIAKLIRRFEVQHTTKEVRFVTRFGNTPDGPLQFTFKDRTTGQTTEPLALRDIH